MGQQRVNPAMLNKSFLPDLFIRSLVDATTGIVGPHGVPKRRKVRSEPGCGPVKINDNSGLKKRMRAAARGVAPEGVSKFPLGVYANSSQSVES